MAGYARTEGQTVCANTTLELESADGRRIVTTREAARFLRVGQQTLRQWASDGRKDRPQPCGWNGRSNLYKLGDLRRFRASRGRSVTPAKVAAGS